MIRFNLLIPLMKPNRRWEADNPEAALAYKRKYSSLHREHILRTARERIKANSKTFYKNKYWRERDRILAHHKKWAKDHPELIKAKSKAYYQRLKARPDWESIRLKNNANRLAYYYANRDAASMRAAKRREAFPERVREIARRSKTKHPDTVLDNSSKRRALLKGSTADKSARIVYSLVNKRKSNKCYYCGKTIRLRKKVHVDHVLPVSRGGNHTAPNLASACQRCNLKKHNKTILELNKFRDQPLLAI